VVSAFGIKQKKLICQVISTKLDVILRKEAAPGKPSHSGEVGLPFICIFLTRSQPGLGTSQKVADRPSK
jgi:hypothetical protein